MNDFDRQSVKDYYGKVLASSADLKTDACCLAESMPSYFKATSSKDSSRGA